MIVKILDLIFKTDKPIEESATQLRGYLGLRFQNHVALHHHASSGQEARLLYEYPKIQYYITRDLAILLAIGKKNIALLKEIVMNVKKFYLGNNVYEIREINAHYREEEFGISNGKDMIRYAFQSPWLALNEDNYVKFKTASISERRTLLEKILIGNILSMSKHLDYFVPSPINVAIELHPRKVSFKNVDMVGFKGMFETNFHIPDYFGVGKAVSHGFGIVKKSNASHEE
jgi:hypothetical protein